MTPTEKRQAASLLRRAKSHLAKTKTDFERGEPSLICYAVIAALDAQADHDVESKLRQLIFARLGGAPTLRGWLAIRGYPVYKDDPKTYALMQKTRLRWMDDLIKELNQPIKEIKHERTASRKNVPHRKRPNGPNVW